jgi:hypothetical protein
MLNYFPDAQIYSHIYIQFVTIIIITIISYL